MKLPRVCLALVALGLAACETTSSGPGPVPVKREVTFTGNYVRGHPGMQKPRMISSVPPRYPVQFRQPGNTGEAIVEFIINPEGRPEQVQYSSATDAAYGEAACAAVRQWRYQPAVDGGKPVSLRALQLVTFSTGPTRYIR